MRNASHMKKFIQQDSCLETSEGNEENNPQNESLRLNKALKSFHAMILSDPLKTVRVYISPCVLSALDAHQPGRRTIWL